MGGGVEGNFSVSFGPNPGFKLWIWAWTKLNKKNSGKRKHVSILAGEHTIKPTEKEKMLGGLLHHSLKWNTHLRDDKESLINQLTSRLNGLRRVCVNASFGTRLMVANGIVMSKLVYLITLWGGAQQYLMSALQVQQLVAARAVCGVGCWRWSRRKLLDKVGWLSVSQLVFFHIVLQAHQTITSPKAFAPSTIQSVSIQNKECHQWDDQAG